ncbi:MAG: hypothetical protein H0W20_12705 [Chthoniobacterales bacterium]|nr:hypothetical protein [Chthoniobacterales bacterium]
MHRADAASQQCYLETLNAANITFYERMGFQRVAEVDVPGSGLRFWTFRRG